MAASQLPWTVPLLPVKKPGTSDPHESGSSTESGVQGLWPEICILQPLIGRGELIHLCFCMDRPSGRLQWATYLDWIAPGIKDTKCRFPAILSEVSWEDRLHKGRRRTVARVVDVGLQNTS